VTRVLLVAPDRVGATMAGPGIRYFELARRLAASHDVRLAAPLGSEPLADAPGFVVYDPKRPKTLASLLARDEVVLAPPLAPRLTAALPREGRRWIVDVYNPEPFEGLEFQKERPRRERLVRDAARVDRISFAARAGCAFVCASERQRDMWLGFLAANRRLDSDLYERDPTMRKLIGVVGFGVPEEPPQPAETAVLRGNVFLQDARIVVWNGGLWDWLDPLTLVRALSLLRAEDDRWRLAFLGTARPGGRAAMSMGARVEREVSQLELGDAVHFNPAWTPYAERGAALLECDMGVSAHLETLETRFAYRTRLVDLVWARVPIVAAAGDEWSARVAAEGLGEVFAPGDVDALAAALLRVADAGRGGYARALDAAAASLAWSSVIAPLLALIDDVQSRPPRGPGLGGRLHHARHSAVAGVERIVGGA
jgi:glycosyltransferase involved in cell wall biosynthesis